MPQETAVGLMMDTIPLPGPAVLTVSAYWLVVKVAATVVFEETVTVQVVAVPLQPPPDQPAKVTPGFALAERTTPAPGE